MRNETPSTKNQAREKHQPSNFRPHFVAEWLKAWGFMFFWTVVFGVWCFSFGPSDFP
jgi:hypothetical protein